MPDAVLMWTTTNTLALKLGADGAELCDRDDHSPLWEGVVVSETDLIARIVEVDRALQSR